jgi:hypothetical protein
MSNAEELSNAFRGLHIQINVVHLGDSVPSEPAGGDLQTSAAPSAAPPQDGADRADRRRVYLVFTCPRSPWICGLWVCHWGALQTALPGGRLSGSGAWLRRYPSVAEAVAAWQTVFGVGAVPLRHP